VVEEGEGFVLGCMSRIGHIWAFGSGFLVLWEKESVIVQ